MPYKRVINNMEQKNMIHVGFTELQQDIPEKKAECNQMQKFVSVQIGNQEPEVANEFRG